jgi:hypothetical protein
MPKKHRSPWIVTAFVVGAVFLLMHWILAVGYIVEGNAMGHFNYWGAPVGTYLILSIVLVGTIVWVLLFLKVIIRNEKIGEE